MIAPVNRLYFQDGWPDMPKDESEKSPRTIAAEKRAEAFGRRLRAVLKSKGLDMDDFWGMLTAKQGKDPKEPAVARETVRAWYEGESTPEVAMRHTIADMFGFESWAAFMSEGTYTKKAPGRKAHSASFEVSFADQLEDLALAAGSSEDDIRQLADDLLSDPARAPYVRMALVFLSRRTPPTSG